MTLAMALSLAGLGVIIGQVLHGGGQHIGDVDPKVYSIGMKLNFISQPIYLWAICVVKLSIGCSLLRIASTKFWRVLILSIQCFMGLYTLGCFFVRVIRRMLPSAHVVAEPFTSFPFHLANSAFVPDTPLPMH